MSKNENLNQTEDREPFTVKEYEKKPADRTEEKSFKKYLRFVLPLLLFFAAAGTAFLPKTEPPKDGTTIKTLDVKGFPVTLVLEQNGGTVKSAWLRTPVGVREISNLEGLTYMSDGAYITKMAQSGKEDLLWRTSYINFDGGKGVHLWIGMSPSASKVFITTTPYNYTKWDNVPAKLVVPKGTAVYISPAVPSYESEETFHDKNSYSFVYTIRMTTEGPTFVPAPDVYRQLAELLKAGMQGEYSTLKRLAYARMLDEFNRLADGNPPSTETLLNFQMNRIDTISWRN